MSGLVHQCISTMLIITFLFTVCKHSKDAIFILDYLPYIEKNVKVNLILDRLFICTKNTTETCNNVLFNDKIYAYNIIVCLIVGHSLIAVDMMS